LYKTKSKTHYKDYVRIFARENGIQLNKNGLLDISVIESLPELLGTQHQYVENGNISPSAITVIIGCGENFPALSGRPPAYYKINFVGLCTQSSGIEEPSKNHNVYRSSTLNDMKRLCRLYREFESGENWLYHHQLYGIATNIYYIEGGIKRFQKILRDYPHWYDSKIQKRWDFYLKYIRDSNYKMENCDNYCPYKDSCNHGANILSTVKPQRGIMKKLNLDEEVLHFTEVVQDDVKEQVSNLYAILK